MRSFVAQCCLAGISEWVVCPGARNAPLLQVLAGCTEIRQWTHFDERSAGFFALGRMMASGLPVGVVTTSGTACAELLPAVIEAHYQGRPLLVVTADRPTEFRGTGAPQAIEQLNLFGNYAPCIDVEDSSEVEEDLFESWEYTGPLHINLCLPDPDLTTPIKEEDFFPVQPPHPEYEPYRLADLAQALRKEARLGLVVMIGGLDPHEQECVRWLAKELKAPVVADATSGLREELDDLAIRDADAVLMGNPPTMVLRLGDVPVCKFWRNLEFLMGVKVFSITRTGFSGLARESITIHGDLDEIVQALGEIDDVGDGMDYIKAGRKRKGLIEELLACYPDSEAGMIQAVSAYASMADMVYLGNSSPIRQWNNYAQCSLAMENVRANRGANGIDGQVSTFLGASADEEETWGIFGDLTAMYDSNALAMASQLSPGKRIMVIINNQGGGIFTMLKGGRDLSPALHRLLVQPQNVSFEHLARMWGAEYACVEHADELEMVENWTEQKLYVLEIKPDAHQTQLFCEGLAQG